MSGQRLGKALRRKSSEQPRPAWPTWAVDRDPAQRPVGSRRHDQRLQCRHLHPVVAIRLGDAARRLLSRLRRSIPPSCVAPRARSRTAGKRPGSCPPFAVAGAASASRGRTRQPPGLPPRRFSVPCPVPRIAFSQTPEVPARLESAAQLPANMTQWSSPPAAWLGPHNVSPEQGRHRPPVDPVAPTAGLKAARQRPQ